MITARDFRSGSVVKYNNSIYQVLESQHHKPGKGGAFVKSKLKNISTGAIVIETLRPEDSFEEVFIEQRPMQYLYRDNNGFCFMDEESFEQIHISEDKMSSVLDYLKENMVVTVNVYEGNILFVTPPIHVILKIVQTDPGLRGNTVSGGSKPATLETGKVIKVPLFLQEGTLIKVDTRTGEYVERA